MRYYVNDLNGDDFKYVIQNKPLHDRNFREVEPTTFQSIMLFNGVYYELPDNKIANNRIDINDVATMTSFALDDNATMAEMLAFVLEDNANVAEMLAYALEEIEKLKGGV